MINDSGGRIVKYGVSNSAMWTGVSDHRPLWVEIKVLDGVKRKASKAKINNVRQTAAGLSKEEHIDEYQRIMMKFCEELAEPDNDQQTALQLEQISLKTVAVVNSILPPKSKKICAKDGARYL